MPHGARRTSQGASCQPCSQSSAAPRQIKRPRARPGRRGRLSPCPRSSVPQHDGGNALQFCVSAPPLAASSSHSHSQSQLPLTRSQTRHCCFRVACRGRAAAPGALSLWAGGCVLRSTALLQAAADLLLRPAASSAHQRCRHVRLPAADACRRGYACRLHRALLPLQRHVSARVVPGPLLSPPRSAGCVSLGRRGDVEDAGACRTRPPPPPRCAPTRAPRERGGAQAFVNSGQLATVLLLLLLGGPLRASTFALLHGERLAIVVLCSPLVSPAPPPGSLGLSIALLWRRKQPWLITLPVSALARSAGVLGSLAVSSLLLRENLVSLVVAQVRLARSPLAHLC